MTLALAIWGAVTGTIVTVVEVVKYLFDRPRLVVGFHLNRSIGKPPEIGINVTNRGRRPTTIMKAAFAPDSEAQIALEEGVVVATGRVDLTLGDEPTVIAANAVSLNSGSFSPSGRGRSTLTSLCARM